MYLQIKEENNSSDSLKYKARLAAKGFSQREVINYNEIFSPIIKYKTIRMIIAIVVQFYWEFKLTHQDSILSDELDDDICMC